MFKVKGQGYVGHTSHMSVVIKADRDWRGVGQPSSCNAFVIVRFLVRVYFVKLSCDRSFLSRSIKV